jgi:voltage-gated potassium channel
MATKSEDSTAAHPKAPAGTEEIGVFQIAILVLSVVVLGALAVNTAFRLPPEISAALQTTDTAICIIFLIDFVVRFRKAESKWRFMRWGWIDLVSSIPNVSGLPYLSHLRWGRVVRILRIIRLIRALRATHKITNILLKDKFKTGVAAMVLVSILLLIFSSLGILICERNDQNANIKTIGDAIWWSVTTLTTVGYGDKYPVTTAGRCLAMIVMIGGMGLFGGLSGLAASFFIGAKEKGIVTEENKILKRLEQLEAKIDRLRRD